MQFAPAQKRATLRQPPAASRDFARAQPGSAAGLPRFLQAKLAVGPVDDPLEHEADATAERVMRMPAPSAAPAQLSRKCAACEGEDKEKLHMKAAGSAGPETAPPIVHDVLRAPGEPLDAPTRAFMEPRFGEDFSGVRVHHDSRAAESARSVGAFAYTAGANLVFGAGQYRPEASVGRRLIAHELAHVAQQGRAVRQVPATLRRAATPDDEAKAAQAQQDHMDQQRNVAQLLDQGRGITPDPSKGPMDGDNLFHNSVEMLDRRIITSLKILSPTHDAQSRNPPDWAYFDTRVEYPTIGGVYPADPTQKQADGLTYRDPGVGAETTSQPGLYALVWLFTPRYLIGLDEFKRRFVHETQHVADLHPNMQIGSTARETALEAYKTEFRAYWIEPSLPPPTPGGPIQPGLVGVPTFAPYTPHSATQEDVTLANPAACPACAPQQSKPGAAGAPRTAAGGQLTVKTKFDNMRQREIFDYVRVKYPQYHVDCFYVCSTEFKNAVDDFKQPASVNLVNSIRVADLKTALNNVLPSMNASDPAIEPGLITALINLDEIDWQFLRNRQQSKPLWDAWNAHVPARMRDGLEKLIALPSKPSTADIRRLVLPRTTP